MKDEDSYEAAMEKIRKALKGRVNRTAAVFKLFTGMPQGEKIFNSERRRHNKGLRRRDVRGVCSPGVKAAKGAQPRPGTVISVGSGDLGFLFSQYFPFRFILIFVNRRGRAGRSIKDHLITLKEPKTASLYKPSLNLLFSVIIESLCINKLKLLVNPLKWNIFIFSRLLLVLDLLCQQASKETGWRDFCMKEVVFGLEILAN